MRVSALVLTLLAALGCDQCSVDPLTDYCPTDVPCAEIEGRLVTDIPASICFVGHIVCDEDGNQTCVGSVQCTVESCNGIDDNGDGLIDEGTDRRYNNMNETHVAICGDTTHSRCGTTGLRCIAGAYLCVEAEGATEEVCDGQDNDCNGVVDDIPAEFFYPTEDYPDTVGVGECAPGIRTCVNGEETLIPARLPRGEEAECGNQLDDDCDGEIDESDGEEGAPIAVSFVVDISGSMARMFEEIRAGGCQMARAIDARTFNSSKFALTTYGDEEANEDRSFRFTKVVQDFTDAESFCAALTAFVDGGSTVQEWQIEGAMTGTTASWPVNMNRHMVFLSDEPIHPYEETLEEGLDRLIESCTTMPFEFHAYLTTAYAEDWSPVFNACGGNDFHELEEIGSAGESILPEVAGHCSDD